jgi:small subunit ribosomal protein S19e
MPAVSVKDVNAHEFIKTYAEYLEKSGRIEVPPWVDVVKTGFRYHF